MAHTKAIGPPSAPAPASNHSAFRRRTSKTIFGSSRWVTSMTAPWQLSRNVGRWLDRLGANRSELRGQPFGARSRDSSSAAHLIRLAGGAALRCHERDELLGAVERRDLLGVLELAQEVSLRPRSVEPLAVAIEPAPRRLHSLEQRVDLSADGCGRRPGVRHRRQHREYE